MSLNIAIKTELIIINEVTISPEKLFYGEKRALCYIHPLIRLTHVRFTVRVGAELSVRVRVGVRIR